MELQGLLQGLLNEEEILISKQEGKRYKLVFLWLHSTCFVVKPETLNFFQNSLETSQETLALLCIQII